MHENAIIALAAQFPHYYPEVKLAIGDDSAILRPDTEHDWLWTTDMLLEDVHFRRRYFSPEELAWKALAVNLSDIAAMAGEARAFTLALGLPEKLPESWIQRFFSGLRQASEYWQVELVGGDTVRSKDRIAISINLLGRALHPIRQQGAQAGDVIMVSGYFGSAAAGLYCLEHDLPCPESLKKALLTPQPRLQEARHLRAVCHRLSLTDASDGLARSLQLLCVQTGCHIDLAAVPVDPALWQVAQATAQDPWHWILQGGEDYELVGCVPPAAQSAAEALGWVRIGIVTTEKAIVLHQSGQTFRELQQPAGFQHF